LQKPGSPAGLMRKTEPWSRRSWRRFWRLHGWHPLPATGSPTSSPSAGGEAAQKVALATRGMGGMNKFAVQAPVMIVVSEMPYVKSAALGARVKGNDYRSIDIGIVTAYLTAEAAAQGLSTCILGWLDDGKIREVCGLDHPVRLVITLGYAKEGDVLRKKVRKELSELVTFVE